jgi:Na+-driven multidrug efflux pump
VTSAIFNGLQMPMTSLKLMAIRTFAIVFPLLFIGSYFGLTAILVALAVGNIASGFLAARMMRKTISTWDRPIAAAKPLQDIRDDIVGLFRRKRT